MCEDLAPGEYLLEIYDRKELFSTEDLVRLRANGIKEAVQMSSITILEAIHDKEDHINHFRARYLQP